MAGYELHRVIGGLARRLSGKPRYGAEVRLRTERLGTDYGGYAVVTKGIGPDSVVYSFGLGEDISFDLELMARTSCSIYVSGTGSSVCTLNAPLFGISFSGSAVEGWYSSGSPNYSSTTASLDLCH